MWKGISLALFNVCAIAIMIGIAERKDESMILIGVYGTLPAVVVGALCGAFASAFAQAHVALRCAMIMVPAAGLVVGLAAQFGMERYIGLANLPTLACCLVLERWTRAVQRDEDEQMPTARVAEGSARVV